MVSIPLSIPADYWQTLQVSKNDIEFLHNFLFESETPMTARELVGILIGERLRVEQESQAKKRKSGGKIYFPKEHYKDGDHLVFPALDWSKGAITSVRPGVNPQYGEFEVLTIEMEDGKSRMFAAGVADHVLNEEPAVDADAGPDPLSIQESFGSELEDRLGTDRKSVV